MKRRIGEQMNQPTCDRCGITIRKYGDQDMPKCEKDSYGFHNFKIRSTNRTIAIKLNEEQICILLNRLLGAPYNTDDLYMILHDKRKELEKQRELEA